VEVVEVSELTGGGEAVAPFPNAVTTTAIGHGFSRALMLLARARVVVSADPTHGSPDYVSPGYAQAMGSGAALVTFPQKSLAPHYMRRPALLTHAHDPALPATIERLLAAEDAEAQERASTGVGMVARQHGISHRLASLASLAGIRALGPC
jgi:hypothetical protein